MDGFTEANELLKPQYFVYALYLDDTLQYIGLSTTVQARVNAHRTARVFKFNRVFIKACLNKTAMEGLEYELIAKYKPPYNTRCGYDIQSSSTLAQFAVPLPKPLY